MENIRVLGFDPADIKLILNSHPHFDHAGGIAAIQQATGARVAASPASAPVLEHGSSGPDDPQYGILLDFPPVPGVERFTPGDTLRVGSIKVASHATAGHTPGGTSWSWESCDADGCVDVVYADSQTPVSAEDFRFTDSETYPDALADFEHGLQVLERLPCDILVTTHPGASSLWERLADSRESLIDPGACQRYAAAARQQLVMRVENETGASRNRK
jgi:metallo-beta-lactamase class B